MPFIGLRTHLRTTLFVCVSARMCPPRLAKPRWPKLISLRSPGGVGGRNGQPDQGDPVYQTPAKIFLCVCSHSLLVTGSTLPGPYWERHLEYPWIS